MQLVKELDAYQMEDEEKDMEPADLLHRFAAAGRMILIIIRTKNEKDCQNDDGYE